MGRLPYFAIGAGEPLVFLAGLSADTGFESGMERKMSASMVKPWAGGRRVVFFNRRSGLPRGMAMGEMAAEVADAIREGLGDGPVDVAGISTGGSIAQQLAADHPDVVRRLVLASTACRLGPDGRELQRRVAARLRKGAYRQGAPAVVGGPRLRKGASRQASAVMMAGLVPPRRGRFPAAVAAWLGAPKIIHSDADAADM